MWTKIDLVWIAGLLEGEGSFDARQINHPNGHRYYTTRIRCRMTDEDVIISLCNKLNIGYIYGPCIPKNNKINGEHRLPFWDYQLNKR